MTEHTATYKKIKRLGLILDEWRYKSCVAHFGTGKNWATLYDVYSTENGKGHATELLKQAKKYYEIGFKKVGGSVALNPAMRHIYSKLHYKIYE